MTADGPPTKPLDDVFAKVHDPRMDQYRFKGARRMPKPEAGGNNGF